MGNVCEPLSGTSAQKRVTVCCTLRVFVKEEVVLHCLEDNTISLSLLPHYETLAFSMSSSEEEMSPFRSIQRQQNPPLQWCIATVTANTGSKDSDQRLGFPPDPPSPGCFSSISFPSTSPSQSCGFWVNNQPDSSPHHNEWKVLLCVCLSHITVYSFRTQPGYSHWPILWDDSKRWINEWKNEWMNSQISSDKLWLKWKWSLGPSDTQNICILKAFHQRN